MQVLHLVLHKLRGTEPDPAIMRFLATDEYLTDIGDDLTDYEEDVAANSFNILRCYVHLFGADAQMRLVRRAWQWRTAATRAYKKKSYSDVAWDLQVERISEFEAQHSRLLFALPDDLRAAHLERQKQAGKEAGTSSWSFPRLIFDEGSYRREHAGATDDDDDERDEVRRAKRACVQAT